MSSVESSPSTARGLDRAIATVGAGASGFAALAPLQRAFLLRQCIDRLVRVAPKWVSLACAAKQIDPDSPRAAEEWLAGPVVTVRHARLLAEALEAIDSYGRPPFGTGSRTLANGKFEVDVFPTGTYDKLALGGFRASVRYPLSVSSMQAAATQASEYAHNPQHRRQELCAVMGAGNVAAIAATDVFSKMFIEGYVCVLKMNPVNEWLGPVLEMALQPLISAGYLHIAYGGAAQGAYLCSHPDVTAIHVTGSRATHDAIVWGPPGPERERRQRSGQPLIGTKSITSELGNVSPVIIVPGTYTDAELHSLAWNVVSMKANNASCNCNSAQVVVVSERWEQRRRFEELLFDTFGKVRRRFDYYPGARDRYVDLLERSLPGFITASDCTDDSLDWAYINGIHPHSNNPLFREEAFCPILAETALPANSAEEFLAQAAAFANARLEGSLNATVILSNASSRNPETAAALETAIEALRYGTVAVNHWPGVSFGLGSTPWGAYPGGTLYEPSSGTGWVHNSYMLEGMEKVVLRGPLVPKPTPPWFANNKNSHVIARRLLGFEANPSIMSFPGVAAAALQG